MSKKITLKNLSNYFSGYGRLIYNNVVGLPKHEQEQIAYRAELCKNDCALQRQCVICGCDYPGRIFTNESCNKTRFPDIMSKQDWEEYKINNNID